MTEPFVSRAKAQEFEYQSLLNPGGKSGLCCLSETTWELAYNLVLFYGYWQSRYYVENPTTGEKRAVTDEEFTLIEDIVDLAIEELQMTGCSDITTALESIATQLGTTATALQAIASKPGCGCESVGTEVPETAETDPPPVGEGEPFEDNEAYDFYKCKAAGELVRRITVSTRLLIDSHSEGYLGLAATVATAALTFVMNAAGLSKLLTVLGWAARMALTLITGESLVLSNCLTFLEENEEELRCSLYCAPNATQARERFNAVVDDSALTDIEKEYLKIYMEFDVVNWLFTYVEELAVLPTVYDCSGCDCAGEPFGYLFDNVGGEQNGHGDFRYDGLEFTLYSDDVGGSYQNIRCYIDATQYPDGVNNWCVQIISYTLDDALTSLSRTFRCRYDTGTGIAFRDKEYQPLSPSFPSPGTVLPCSNFNWANPTAFSVTLKIVGGIGSCSDTPDLEPCV